MNTPSFDLAAYLRSIQEELDHAALMDSLRSVDLSRVQTGTEKFLEQLKTDPGIKKKLRQPKKQPTAKPRKHWTAVRREKREREIRRYARRRTAGKIWWEGVLTDPDQPKAWYTWLSKNSTGSRDQKRKGWTITLEEFREYIYPALTREPSSRKGGALSSGGRVPTLSRYDCSLGWSMDNTLWIDKEDGTVLFDGKEHTMKLAGYIL